MGPKVELKHLICHKQGPTLEYVYVTVVFSLQTHHVRFKVKEYKQIKYVLWAAKVGRWSKGQNKLGVPQRTFKLKKDLKIPYVSHFICLLIVTCTLHAKSKFFKKMYACCR